MRILHLLASPAYSGPAENVAFLAQAQRELGHAVTIAVDRKRPGPPNEEPIVPRLQALGLLDEGGLELSVKSTPRGLWRDARALRRRPVDVVHAHFTHDHLLARWARPKRTVLVRSLHAPRSLRWSLPAADGYTVPTGELAHRLSGRRVQVLGPLLDPAFRPVADRPAQQRALGVEARPLIGMVSNLQPSRRHLLGLEAFSRLLREQPGARLALIGEGPLEAELRARSSAADLQGRVHFAGYQEGPAFVRWLQALDEVWVLGLGNDWSGRAAAQARACGVRVVAVREGALEQFADALVEESEPDAVVRASLGGARRAGEGIDNRVVAAEVLALYAAAGAPR